VQWWRPRPWPRGRPLHAWLFRPRARSVRSRATSRGLHPSVVTEATALLLTQSRMGDVKCDIKYFQCIYFYRWGGVILFSPRRFWGGGGLERYSAVMKDDEKRMYCTVVLSYWPNVTEVLPNGWSDWSWPFQRVRIAKSRQSGLITPCFSWRLLRSRAYYWAQCDISVYETHSKKSYFCF
jgi:hypothetical protein